MSGADLTPPHDSDHEPGTTWADLLTTLVRGEDLSGDQTAWAMDRVMSGEATPSQLAAFLSTLRAKGETVPEMTGLATMMLEHAHRFTVEGPSIDIVGTGGDRAHTVNISSMSAIVMAASGAVVVKHGNRAASSKSGSADMLEALGVRLDLSPEQVAGLAGTVGITFCFAQTFHPSMRHAAVVRKDLGIATAFNFLGPLTNPAQPRYAAVGSADARMAELMAGVFAARGTPAAVFRGDDGLDEITPATTSTVWWVDATASISRWSLHPQRLGLPLHPVDSLRGADAQHNAEVARQLFDGSTGAVRDAVLLNAGTALALLSCGEQDAHPRSEDELHRCVRAGMDRAEAALDDGSASQLVERWVSATRALG
ncbi:MAG: anthranilate phosphoribosyltransferase [Ornithinimicrobium sp.]|uniref:anthranilate phosphoribosyltransferase n=1 Tax=Ornithinimicrobium sp. TaxID=1977084 RepID=UPI0026DFA0EF|nr:anthranilate phosphoribosyltransferase [Ornithinimicrobium sp.]MDO5741078.1 anthranilate phosphoribosyltransferase [Ornithinimicrobium sp.]